jgi:hypothetical protein
MARECQQWDWLPVRRRREIRVAEAAHQSGTGPPPDALYPEWWLKPPTSLSTVTEATDEAEEECHSLADDSLDPARLVMEAALRQALTKAIEALPGGSRMSAQGRRQRRYILLRHLFDGATNIELAREMNLDSRRVNQYLRRGARLLRPVLEQWGLAPES